MDEQILELTDKQGRVLEIPITGAPTKDLIMKTLQHNGIDPNEYAADIDMALGASPDPKEVNYDDMVSVSSTPKPKQVDPRVGELAAGALNFPAGSTDRSREIGVAKNAEDILGIEKPAKLSAAQQDDINALKDILKNIKPLLEKKNSGLGGEGIDTGPLVGGGVTLPEWMGGAEFNFVPAGVSEWLNKGNLGVSDKGEAAGDRAVLRQLEKILFNPQKKDISGTAASDQERFKDLMPLIPSEGDNDQAFFSKGFTSIDRTIAKMKSIIETAKSSGMDVSGLEPLMNMDANAIIEQLQKELSQNPNGSFAREFPETVKKFKSGAAGGLKATKKYNPATGQFEEIQ